MAEAEVRHQAMVRFMYALVAYQAVLLRQVRGWSREELSRRAGISVAAIRDVEQGRESMSIKALKAMAQAFDVGLEVRFEHWPSPPPDFTTEGFGGAVPAADKEGA